jgi:glycosyltransferase involved in cell wall biosynthesis
VSRTTPNEVSSPPAGQPTCLGAEPVSYCSPQASAALGQVRVLELNSLLTGGGTDDRGLNVARGLIQLGHAVWLAGPGGRAYSQRAQAAGVPLHPVPTGGLLRLPLIVALVRLLRRHRPDIVQARHGRDYWPAVLAVRLSGLRPRLVLCRHLAKSPSSWFSRRYLLSVCDAMVAVSCFVARVLREGVFEPDSPEPERRRRPPMRGDIRKIHVIYDGFDLDRFKPTEPPLALRAQWGLKPQHFAFGVVGGYNRPRGKGQREFLQAAARVAEVLPQARFLIIGRGNLGPVLEADIHRLGLQGRAWLTPYCLDMAQGMNALDCLVHPQVGTEALPGVVIEAHACGKPVIATTIDGNPEAFQVAGYGQLIPPESVEALAAAMQRWATRPPLDMPARWELHRRVREQFSLDQAARNYVALYQRLLAA